MTPAYLENPADCRRVRQLLVDYMSRGWKDLSQNKPRNFNISCHYDHRIIPYHVLSLLKNILKESCLGKYTKKAITQMLRYTPRNRRTIKQRLVNNKKMIKTWSHSEVPKCAGKRWCKHGIHYSKTLEDNSWNKKHIKNTNTIPKPADDTLKYDMKLQIARTVHKFAIIQNPHIAEKPTWERMTSMLLTLNISIFQIQEILEQTETLINTWLTQNNEGEEKQTKTHHEITEEDVQTLKRNLSGLVIAERDKNGATLYCECPVLYHRRLVRSFYKLQGTIPGIDGKTSNIYQIIEDETTEDILERMKNMYDLYRLEKIAPWSESGELPIGFVNPKEKNLTEKERAIASYFKSNMKKVFRRTGKILTWLLRQIPENIQHFTLHKLSNLKAKIKQAPDFLRRRYGRRTKLKMFCSDVKQMFTFLSHNEIMKALEWMLDIMSKLKQYTDRGGIDRTPRKSRKNKVTLVVETGEIYWGKSTHEEYRKPTGSPDDIITLDFKDLRAVVMIDLAFTHSTVGKTILKQNQGCPIGGILSSFYANLVCARNEHSFLTKPDNDRKDRIYGIRQIDDLTLWIAYEHDNKESEQQANDLLGELLDQSTGTSAVYTHGLTLELEQHKETKQNGMIHFEHDFAGTTISGDLNSKAFECKTLNKNWMEIKYLKQQKVVRYPPADSYIHQRIKTGMIIGSYVRLESQNSTTQNYKMAVEQFLEELWTIGYEKGTLIKATNKLRHKETYRDITKYALYHIRNYLNN